MTESSEFTGVKAALIYKGELLVYLRDNKPGLRFAGLWDFFGGGREGNETPNECIKREVNEELCMNIRDEQIVFTKLFPAMYDPSENAYFVVIELEDQNIAEMEFGEEGQEYKFISIEAFMNDDSFIEFLRPRMQSYLDLR